MAAATLVESKLSGHHIFVFFSAMHHCTTIASAAETPWATTCSQHKTACRPHIASQQHATTPSGPATTKAALATFTINTDPQPALNLRETRTHIQMRTTIIMPPWTTHQMQRAMPPVRASFHCNARQQHLHWRTKAANHRYCRITITATTQRHHHLRTDRSNSESVPPKLPLLHLERRRHHHRAWNSHAGGRRERVLLQREARGGRRERGLANLVP